MADRLGEVVDGANIRIRFLKGLANLQVWARVENLIYLLSKTFEAMEAVASYHEKSLRRDKSIHSNVAHTVATATDTEKRSRDLGDTVRLKDDSLHRVILVLKRELTIQKQQIARMQLNELCQSKPDRPCFHCGSPDHFKRSCPDWLAKRGVISQVTMTDLFEMDLGAMDEVACVEEAIQHLQSFIADTEFTPNVARQVTFIDLGEQEGVEFLSQAMSGVVL